MQTLENAKVGEYYMIRQVHVKGDILHHLQDLGMTSKAKVCLVTLGRDSGILLLQHARIALDRSILRLVEIQEVQRDEVNWLPLSQVKVGMSCLILSIHGTGVLKRRLMDMGLTKGTKIFVRKTAPLGDPVEINLRGYALTLRKSEAEMVLVTPLES